MTKTLTPWRRRNEPARLFRDFQFPDLWSQMFEDADLQLPNLPETFRRGLVPAMNVSENEKEYVVTLDLPGLDENDFDIQLMGNRLVISGERRWKEEKKEKEYVRVESQYGSFTRTVDLPDGSKTQPEKIAATYEKGILEIVVPKSEPTPSTKIKVKKA